MEKEQLTEPPIATTTDLGIGFDGKMVLCFSILGITERLRIFNPKPAVVARRYLLIICFFIDLLSICICLQM